MEAGTEARIPPEFIQQAIDAASDQHSPTQKPVPMAQNKNTSLVWRSGYHCSPLLLA
jgi:hypothetical protein